MITREPPRTDVVVISCEHGGNAVPTAYAEYFSDQRALLDSHRGWDPGALPLARQMARALSVPLQACTTTRLLVDLNRSIGHRQLFSEVTRPLPPGRRRAVVEQHYRPHRNKVESAIAAHIANGRRVIHIASHSFTPELGGVVRQADVAWLYDPRRAGECRLARAWMTAFAQHLPGLRLRRNYPYQGRSDGLTSWLRKRHPAERYVGIELEVNQRFVMQPAAGWDRLRAALVASLQAALTTPAPATRETPCASPPATAA